MKDRAQGRSQRRAYTGRFCTIFYHRLDMFPPGDPLRLGCSHGDPRLYAMAGKESV